MGLLDDAIKEHLELKRKHGAPEEEVQRQQDEALGPVRREAAPQPESVEAAETAATDGDAVAPELGAGEPVEDGAVAEGPEPGDGDQLFDGEALTADRPAPVDEVAPPEEPVRDAAPVEDAPPLEEAPVAEEAPVPEQPAAPEPVAEEPLLDADPEAPEPASGHGDTPPGGFEPVEEQASSADPGATIEYDPFADEEPEQEERTASGDEEDEGDEGDVLEDTPDFLQETPEHDRLWFEQKPPRDFDFE